jgi:hypothetical protein
MRNRTNTLLILLTLAFGVFFLANRYVIARASAAEDGKRKWEYGHLYSSSCPGNVCKAGFKSASTPAGQWDEIDSTYDGLGALNNLGAQGWELVAIVPNGNQPEYLLKRLK